MFVVNENSVVWIGQTETLNFHIPIHPSSQSFFLLKKTHKILGDTQTTEWVNQPVCMCLAQSHGVNTSSSKTLSREYTPPSVHQGCIQTCIHWFPLALISLLPSSLYILPSFPFSLHFHITIFPPSSLSAFSLFLPQQDAFFPELPKSKMNALCSPHSPHPDSTTCIY